MFLCLAEKDVSETDQRLRAIENWQAGHEEKCNGRQEKVINVLESLKMKSDQNTAALSGLGKRVKTLEQSKSWVQGYAAAIGSVVGIVFIKIVLSVFGIKL